MESHPDVFDRVGGCGFEREGLLVGEESGGGAEGLGWDGVVS